MRGLILLFIFIPALLPAQVDRLFERADSLAGEGQLRVAIRQLEEVIRDYPRRDHDCSDAYLAISRHYLTLADFGAALQANQRSLEIRDNMRSDDTAENYARFGEIYLALGRYEQALSYLERARDLPFLFPELYAHVNALTGEALHRMGRPDGALRYYDKAITLLEIEFGAEDPLLEPYLTGAGGIALAGGLPGRAAAYFRRALALTEEPTLLYQLIGEAALAAGEDLEARDELRRALRWYEANPNAQRIHKAKTELTLAQLAAEEGNDVEEQRFLDRAVRTLCPRFAPTDFFDNPQPRELILDRILLSEALGKKIQLLLRRGDPADLEAAVAAAQSGMDMIDLFLPYSDPGKWQWRMATDKASTFFASATEAAYRQYEATGGERYRSRAFEFAERARQWEWRLYQLSLLRVGPYQEALAAEMPVRRWLQEAEAALGLDPDDRSRWIAVKQRQGAIDQLIEQHQREQPALYQWLYSRDFARPRELPTLLPEETLLVAYYVTPEKTFLTVADATQIELLVLPYGAEWLAQEVSALLGSMERRDAEALAGQGARLYEALFAPFAARLKKKEQLVIIPHGPLYHLPFGALNAKTYRGGNLRHRKLGYLGVDYALSLATTVTQWRDGRQRGEGKPAVDLVTFAPDFSGNNGRVPTEYSFVFDTLFQTGEGLRAAVPKGRTVAPLPKDRFTELAAGFGPAQIFPGAAATEANLRAQVSTAGYLHLRTHAFANPQTPSLSGLLLTPASGTETQDGLLWSPDLYSLNWADTRVSLDGFRPEAPETGLPGSWFALASPWLQAGARSCTGSVAAPPASGHTFWPVFYQKVAGGASPAQALQSAADELVRSKEWAAPWYWGRFLVVE